MDTTGGWSHLFLALPVYDIMDKKALIREHLESKIESFATAAIIPAPPIGRIKEIRMALGMSMG